MTGFYFRCLLIEQIMQSGLLQQLLVLRSNHFTAKILSYRELYKIDLIFIRLNFHFLLKGQKSS